MNLRQMEEESDCIETIFQSYITLKSTCTVFLFFEGKDDFKYYWCRLSPFVYMPTHGIHYNVINRKIVCNRPSYLL